MRTRLRGFRFKYVLIFFLLSIYALYCTFLSGDSSVQSARTQPDPLPLPSLVYQIKAVPEIYRNARFGSEYTLLNAPYINETVKEFRTRYLATKIKKDQIFILVPSYRDPLCNSTIFDIFKSCKYCENVFVGLVLQLNFHKDEDKVCTGSLENRYAQNIRTIYLPNTDAKGPIYGRLLASKLWEGEEYILGIDSHMDFVNNWDEKMIQDYKNVPNMLGKVDEDVKSKWFNDDTNYLFSTYPRAMVEGEDATVLENDGVPFICDVNFEEGEGNSLQKGFFTQKSTYHYTPKLNGGLILPSHLIGAGFIFANSRMLYDAPYDPYVPFLFIGEELSMNLQLWTRGNYLTHKYGGAARSVYSDASRSTEIKEKSVKRVAYQIGLTTELPEDISELDEFQLGTRRTLQEWEEFSGIHIKNQTFTQRCEKLFNFKSNKWE